MTTPEDSQPQPSSGEPTLQQKFFRYFQQEVTALQDQMDRIGDRPLIAGERADAADHCLAGISRLSSEVKDASTYLPSYDQRTYAEAVKALQDKLQETRAAFAPKQKFSFKSARKSPSAISLSDAAELAAQKRRGVPGYLSPNGNTPGTSQSGTPAYLQTPPDEKSTSSNRPVPDAPHPSSLQQATSVPATPEEQPSRPALSTTATSTTISSQSHAHILLPSSSIAAPTPCTISRLTSCILDLSTSRSASFASLTINNATSSLLCCGTVNGPAHVTGLRNCTLVIVCRQLRMHECAGVNVYLHCTSRPIIEDCKGMRFAQLPQTYFDLTAAGQSGLADSANLWDQIDDFKWLKSEPSPNWSVLPVGERVPEETWREVVPGGPGWRTEDILKAVGIQPQSGR
ncbi:uncharacterized protein HMPREF1541_00804 [Cyphellophora europaea CBS 101466]|uniref:C-CAP/cofactor C-like domain-containing protein n=1 Tax=Cyphellophora europaea (strain CBS 101466) TaxID=1220924 RepID=W2SF07_CYPE1|nr:uncharacterized protein HMPREF1541_00804 [Cyphellophora europaea CBS 101466]ETN46618.1 hypothetical protein HMPREF1541_00804 [Cyphellophora europaea CBS 101466]